MADYISFDIDQGIESESGNWYKIVQILGTGGTSTTFLVYSTSGFRKGMLFALKVFRKLSEPDRRGRFLNEIDFLKGCQHPAILRVYDAGTYRKLGDEYPFVLVEYLPNTLREVISSQSASITECLSITTQLLSALAFLDGLEPPVVHRDIKPENIFIHSRSCVLGDFGLHKLLDGSHEDSSSIFYDGGPRMPFMYRSPDLIQYAKGEGSITTKSDVFQLGLVIAELFTGFNPAKKPNNILDPLELNPLGNIPGNLSGLIITYINRMLEYDPERRPSASQLMDPWIGIFQEAVALSHELQGRAF